MRRRPWLLAAGALLLTFSIFARPSRQVPSGPQTGQERSHEGASGAPDDAGAPEGLPVPPSETAVDAPAPNARAPVAVDSSELVIFLPPGTDPQAFAQDQGLRLRRTLKSNPNGHVFASPNPAAALALRNQARTDPRLGRVYLNRRTQHIHCAFVPNDQWFPDNTPAPFHGQWHLGNGASSAHANLAGAWNRDVTGQGVLIGIVDDCLETAHPDLAPNYVAPHSFNFGNLTPDPNPNPAYDGTPNEDLHGTSVSGVAAARGGNGIGVTGAAPLAGLAGLRIDFVTQTEDMFYDATVYHSTGADKSIKVKNHSYGYSVPYIPAPLEAQGVTESATAGTIHCFAAGNERGSFAQDSNKTEPQNNPRAIAVAALGSDGKFSSYSSFGANVVVTAPSSGVTGFGIMTTDRVGNRGYNVAGTTDGDSFADTNYTSTFGGTSSATPLTTGILALGKQVRPNLDVRFAKHALARSSVQVDPTDATVTGGGDGTTAGSAWKTNAAGFKFNQNYGFGKIDADAFITKLFEIDGVTPGSTLTVGVPTPVAVAAAIPDNNPTGITRTFTLSSVEPLEDIQVSLNISHTRRGQLEAYLTSPSGTTGRLFFRSSETGDNIDWSFVTHQFWGENPTGTWSLRIADLTNPTTGTWNSYAITARTGSIILNTTSPSVASIVRLNSNPTNAGSVSYLVTFTEPVTGVNAADFALTSTGTLAGASITGVTGKFCEYVVTVNTGTGDGTLRLDVVDDDTIQDSLTNPLGGAGVGNGNFTTGQAYTIDRTPPTVTINQAAGQVDPTNGSPILFTVTFNEPVVGFATGDVTLSGTAGATTAAVSGPGPIYTVSVTGMTAQGTVIASLAAGVAADLAGNLSLASTSLDNTVTRDTTPPTVTINQAAGQSDPAAVGPILFTVVFSESVNGFASNDVSFAGSTAPGTLAANVSGGPTTYTVSVSGMTGPGTVRATLPAGAASDAAGNLSGASTSTDTIVTYTPVVPSVTINQAGGQGDPTNSGPIVFNVVFSEAVNGFATGDVSFAGSSAGGTLAGTVTGASPGTNFTVSVTGMTTSGLVVASIPAGVASSAATGTTNAASTSSDNSVLYDVAAPTVTIEQAGGQLDPTNGASIQFTATFSEVVTGFTGVDVSFAGSTVGGTLAANVTGGGAIYTVTVTGMTGNGTVVVSIPAAAASDLAGNSSSASTSFDNSVTRDVVAPTVTINQAVGQADPTNGASIQFTVTFSETVNGFANGEVSFAGSTVGGALVGTVTGGGADYTVTVTGMTGSGTVVVSIPAAVAADPAGNTNAASTSTDNTVTRDVTAPTVTINQAGGQGDPAAVGPILFTVVFSETVTGFAANDVSFTGSTAPGTLVANVSGPGPTYTVSVTGMTGNGTVVASIPVNRAADLANNNNVASTSTDNTVTYTPVVPSVTINQAGGQADPTNGASIVFNVVFSEAVNGFATGDVSFAGSTAGGTVVGTVTGASPGTTFTVTVTGMTSSGLVAASIPAGVATSVSSATANAASTSTDNQVTFDNSAPTVTINQSVGQLDPTNVASIQFTVTFSEPVTGFATGEVSFAGSTVGGALVGTVTGAGAGYTVTVTGMSGTGTVVISIPAGVAADSLGNQNAASTSTDNTVAYDGVAPTVTINQAGGQADPTNGASIQFAVLFSEPVTGFVDGEVSFAGSTVGGALVGTVAGAGASYTVTVTGMTGSGIVVVSVPAGVAADPAGNQNAASTSLDNSVTRDVGAPTVTINQAVGQVDPTNGVSIVFTVTFSETVVNFATGDVSFTGSTVGGSLVGTVTGSGADYTVTVTGMTGNGTVVASIPAGRANDLANNPSVASTSLDNSVTRDVSAPTVTINQEAGQVDPTNGSPILFTVVFSETVANFATGDVTLGGTAGATTAVVSGTGTTYTVSVSGMSANGTVTASIGAGAASDAAGNGNGASSSTDNTVTYNTLGPTVTINQAGGQADPTNASPILFTVVFSSAVTGFATGDVTLGGTAGATTAVVSGTGTTYTVAVSGMTSGGTVTASIGAGVAIDGSSNGNVASTSSDNTVLFDTTAPTVTINQAGGQADPTNASPILFTVVFSEVVTTFATGDVTLGGTAGATTATVSGSGTTYMVSVTGMTQSGTVIASLAAGVAPDAAGNASAASTSLDNTVAYDVTPPSVTINQAAGQADPTNASPILFTVVFNKSVTGFATGDVTLGGSAGATTAAVTGTGTTYTVSVSGMTGNGTVTASISAGVATDAAGNANAVSTSTDNTVTYDNSAPTVTINQAGGQADPTNGSSILFAVTFSEAVTGFATGDVTLGGTAGATTATVAGGGTTYTVTVTGMTGDGTVTVSIAAGVATDAAGNGNSASTSFDNTVTRDATAPTVTINQAVAQPDPANSSPILFTAVFSEPVTGFVSADVIVGGTAGGVAAVSGGPTTYTISVSGVSGDGTVTVTIPANAAADSSGNNTLASTSADNTVTFDATDPVVTQVTSTTANGAYGAGEAIAITVVFSEPVVVSGIPQLTLETGAADAVVNFTSGSGTATLVFTYTVAAGHVSTDLDVASALALALNGGAIRDPANNDATLTLAAPGSLGSLGASKDLVVDTTPPLAGSVNDGWTAPDVDAQLSVTTLSANWSGFSDPESGITGYEWAIGTTSGGQQILPFTPVGLQTSASTSAVDLVLALSPGSTFYVTIRATNGAGLTVTATSDGVTVSGPAASVAAPAGLWAVPDNQAVLLEWLASPSLSTSFYRVWWKPASSPWTQAVRVDPLAGLSTVIPGLTNGTPYDFMIKAVDASENESPGAFANATPQASITIGGLGNYGSAQAAIDAAVSGETVVLGPGTYPGPLTLHPGISLQGSSPVHTIITGSITVEGTFPADLTSTIGNLTLTGGTIGVDGGTADVLLDHVIIHHMTSHGASSAAGGRLRAVNCTVMSNGGDGLRALGTAEMRNCIVGKNLGAGLNVPAGAVVNYDNVYGNGISDYPAAIGGTGNLTAPAVFLNEPANIFIEDSQSSTVDTGAPPDAFSKELAPNGGRINQGAFGNTRWAASKGTTLAVAGGRKRGGGCGLTGLEAVALLVLLAFRNRRNR